MRITLKAVFLPLFLTLSACQPPGSYDNHGNYHSSDQGFQGQNAITTNATDDKDAVSFDFKKPGFYDYKGNYVEKDKAPNVPEDFLPPSGMCRVWLPDRALSTLPPAEDCRPKYHLHEGAYVIYGG